MRRIRPVAGSTLVRLLLVAPCVLLILAVFAYPVAQVLMTGFRDASGFTAKYYGRVFGSSTYVRVLSITLGWSAVVTAVCLALGYPVAYVLSHARGRRFSLLAMLVIIPFFMSILIRTYAWMILLGRHGVFNGTLAFFGVISSPLELLHNTFAVVVGMVQVLLPFMILALFSVMKNIDANLVRAAHTLGANPLRAFLGVFVPLSVPGIAAGCLLVFITSVGFYVTPAVLGGPKDVWIAMLIEAQVTQLVDWGFAAALSGVLFAVIVLLWSVYEWLSGVDRVWGDA